MPSFDAPILLEPAPSRLLACWCAAWDAAAMLVLGATVLSLGLVGATIAVPVLAAALATAACFHWRAYGQGRGQRVELHADGTLIWRSASARRPLRICAVQILRCGPFLRLRGLRQVGPGRWQGWSLSLARDGVDENGWRRCCAWSRAGLPDAEAAPTGLSR